MSTPLFSGAISFERAVPRVWALALALLTFLAVTAFGQNGTSGSLADGSIAVQPKKASSTSGDKKLAKYDVTRIGEREIE